MRAEIAWQVKVDVGRQGTDRDVYYRILPQSDIIRRAEEGSTPLRRLLLYLVFAILGFTFVLLDEDFWDITGKAERAATMRNAQNLEDLFSAALIGAAPAIKTVSTAEEAVALLSQGTSGGGMFSDSEFRIELDPEEQLDALEYLSFEDGILIYTGR